MSIVMYILWVMCVVVTFLVLSSCYSLCRMAYKKGYSDGRKDYKEYLAENIITEFTFDKFTCPLCNQELENAVVRSTIKPKED